MNEFRDLQAERYKIEKEMLELAEEYLFQDISSIKAEGKALKLILNYNYVMRKLEELVDTKSKEIDNE
jgi:hypothetical protein